jgi:hypothetical protein
MSSESRNDDLESVMRELEASRERIAPGDEAASRHADEAVARYDRASRGFRIGWFLPLLALLVAGYAYFKSQSSDEAAAPPKPEHDRLGAWTMAQQFVEPKLVAPADAHFFCDQGSSVDCVEKIGDGRYRVRGLVDAPNRLGVKIRARFDVTVEYAGEQKWKQIGEAGLQEQ